MLLILTYIINSNFLLILMVLAQIIEHFYIFLLKTKISD